MSQSAWTRMKNRFRNNFPALGDMLWKDDVGPHRDFHAYTYKGQRPVDTETGLPLENSVFFPNNSVTTSKYNIITFIPRSLFEQFRRLANIYFLFISILMMLGTYTDLFDSPLSPWSTLVPLVIVLSITMAKEGFEDLKRHQSDSEVNNRLVEIWDETYHESENSDPSKQWKNISWKDLSVGNIVKLKSGHELPADIVLLTTSEEKGIGFVETSNIDGETNLKIKNSPATAADGSGPAWTHYDDITTYQFHIQCEHPNASVHSYKGMLEIESMNKAVALDQSNLLLRGSTLRNTKWACGIVVYTGRETKLVQNSREAPSKLSTIETTINNMIYLIFGCQFVLVTISLIAYIVWTNENYDNLYYLCYNSDDAPDELFRNNCDGDDDYVFGDAGYWFTFLILYNNFIPISLYVTVEVINYIQAYYIDQDIEMYDEFSDTPSLARTSNANGDLGQIEYIFSDKTGTLTQNIMNFKRCSISNRIYGSMDDQDKEVSNMSSRQTASGPDIDTITALALNNPNSPYFDFILNMAICHTVINEKDPETGQQEYQAESPDEEALVKAAKRLGITFEESTPNSIWISIETPDGIQRYEYNKIAILPFNSTRKRMSIIFKTPEIRLSKNNIKKSKIILFCKGADNIIFDRTTNWENSSLEVLNEHLSAFASDGLRTLVLAQREFDESFMSNWQARYEEASVSMDRDERLIELAKEVECELATIGVTAIEDKLQDEVPQTIADLANAGIKLWVLTGDKMETAINIGYSARILVPEMVLIKLKMPDKDPDAIKNQLRGLVDHFGRLTQEQTLFNGIMGRFREAMKRNDEDTLNEQGDLSPALSFSTLPQPLIERPEAAPEFKDLTSNHLALIVDGPTLTFILGDAESERLLLTIGRLCKAVIACRVSPAQKRMLVRLVKRGISPEPVTLAIGDGANDVGMIQEAQVGVGISGKEGRQAVNTADFAIAQFRFLKRLLLLHGRWDYRRICRVVLYSFYKNVVLTFILFYYSFYCGFSGQSLYESLVYSGFNWFLAMPILCVGIFDRDISAKTALNIQAVYISGLGKLDMNVKVACQWGIKAVLDSLIIYFVTYGIFNSPLSIWSENGYSNGIYIFGTTVYSVLILAMMYKAISCTYTWTNWSWFFLWGSLVLYFGFLALYQLVISYSPDFYYIANHLYNMDIYWLTLFLVPLISALMDLLHRAWQKEWSPHLVIDNAIEYDRGVTQDPNAADRLGADHRRLEVGSSIPERGLPIDRDSLRLLNSTIGDDNRKRLGIFDEHNRIDSSFNFDHLGSGLGPGAGDSPQISIKRKGDLHTAMKEKKKNEVKNDDDIEEKKNNNKEDN